MTDVATGLVDCMAHLDDERVGDPSRLLRRAVAAGVTTIVNAGFDPLSPMDRTNNLPEEPGVRVFYAFGVHPMAIRGDGQAQLQQLERLLERQGVVAVGEAGLDGRPGAPPWVVQEAVFRNQLQLATQLRLPIILHCVRSIGRLLNILEQMGPLPSQGVLHGFGGPAELIEPLARLGLFFGVGGLVTMPTAKRCRRAAAAIPADRLVLESDTPDHPPQGAGPWSEPASVVGVLQVLCDLRGTSLEALAPRTTLNAAALLGELCHRGVN